MSSHTCFLCLRSIQPRKRKVLRRRAHIPAGDAGRHPEEAIPPPSVTENRPEGSEPQCVPRSCIYHQYP